MQNGRGFNEKWVWSKKFCMRLYYQTMLWLYQPPNASYAYNSEYKCLALTDEEYIKQLLNSYFCLQITHGNQ